jgi:hypothetical protein
MKEEIIRKERDEESTSAVVRNEDWCFQVREYNSCCAGLHNINKTGKVHSLEYTGVPDVFTPYHGC